MNIIQKFVLLIVVFAGSFVVLGANNSASAIFEGSKGEACKGANLSNSDSTCNSDAASTKLSGIIKDIINVLAIVVGIVAVIVLIMNGLKFITSNGDANAIASAKNGIIYALVGLVIVALSQVIVRFVLGKV